MKVIFLKDQNPANNNILYDHYVSQKVYAVENGTCIVVSAANVPDSGPETYIFPSNLKGNIFNYIEMNGSFRGSLDFNKALSNGGYVECNEKWSWVFDENIVEIESAYYKFTDCVGINDGVYFLKNFGKGVILVNNFYIMSGYIKENNEKIIKLTKDDLMIRDIIE